MDSNTIVERVKGLEFSRLDEAYLAIDADAGYCYGLNSTAGAIWDRIDAPISVSEICARLGRDYDADEDTLRRDVLALLSSLRDAGLVQIVP